MKIWELPGFPNCKVRSSKWTTGDMCFKPSIDGIDSSDLLRDDWELYEEPKKSQKVKLYRKKVSGGWSNWSTSEFSLLPNQIYSPEITEFQTIEIEVPEK